MKKTSSSTGKNLPGAFGNENNDIETKTSPHSRMQQVWLDKQDILLRMNISNRTLQNWRSNGILPFSRIRGKIYYRETDLNELLHKNLTKLGIIISTLFYCAGDIMELAPCCFA